MNTDGKPSYKGGIPIVFRSVIAAWTCRRGLLGAVALAGISVLSVSCGESIGPEDVAEIRISAGNGQIADAGTEVPTQPAVLALAEGGEPIPGVSITFSVADGGGTATPTAATTDQDGIARTEWTLGDRPGDNRLTASTARLTTELTFTATGVLGPAARVEPRTGDQQTATAGRPVDLRLSVTVTDQVGNPVPGISVTWAVASGGGQISGTNTSTGTDGVATLVEWILGPDPGTNTVTATADGLAPAVFTATGVVGPALLAVVEGDNQTAEVNTSVPIPPTVQVTDARGNPLAGISVAFIVSQGGGSVSSESAITDAGGLASVEWTLGTQATTNVLFVQAVDLPLVSFTATGAPGAPAALLVSSGNNQFGLAGTELLAPPAVRVEDAFTNAVPGVSVQFVVTGGGGSLTDGLQVSDENGVAAAGTWTLGADPGVNTVDASVAGVPSTTFTATGLSVAYDIDLRVTTSITQGQRQALDAAVARWQELVVGDLPEVSFSTDTLAENACGINHPALTEIVDDLLIFVEITDIDGPGGTLGSAGPCVLRDIGFLTVVGVMRFDDADLQRLETDGRLVDLFVHEIAHILGFGTLWDNLGLLVNPSLPGDEGADTHFSGPRAIAAFDAAGGVDFTGGSKVPVENQQGGAGTRDSHWRESTFGSELLTGFLDSGGNPLSAVTVESLGDLQYIVNAAGADPYSLPISPLVAAAADVARVELVNDIWRGPLYRVDSEGRIVATVRY